MMSEEEYQDSLRNLRRFNLKPITKRMKERHGVENAEELENKFRRFAKARLQMMKNGENKPLSPSPELDEYWHEFILDTLRYHAFCEEIFGKYIHHVPGLPDENEGDEDYVESMELWMME